MTEAIRWGILGAGRVARDFAEGLRALPDVELVAVASRTPGRGESFARQFKPRRLHPTYQALAEDGDVDVVYVATPHHRHLIDSLLCLEHDKPVLCEKPFTVDADEARQVMTLARARGLFCMEAMWMRFIPLIRRVQALVAQGAIGDVLTLTADFGVPTPFEPQNRFFNAALGGGALLDRGVYALSLASMLLGQPDQVVGQAVIGSTGVDEQSAILLHYPANRLAILAASLRTYTSNQAAIMGSRGTIRIHAPFYRPHQLSLSTFSPPGPRTDGPVGLKEQLTARARQSHLVRRIYQYVKPLVRGGERRIVEPIRGNGYNYEAAEVGRCLRAGALESPIMPLDETLRIQIIMDQLRASWGAAQTR